MPFAPRSVGRLFRSNVSSILAHSRKGEREGRAEASHRRVLGLGLESKGF